MTVNTHQKASGNEPEDPQPRPCSRLACDDCGRPFETFAIDLLGSDYTPVRICQTCTIKKERAEADAKAAKITAIRQARFDKLAGPYYTGEEIRAAMPADKARACRALVQSGQGIMAHGMSGKFKTTCVLNGAVRWLILNGHEVTYMTAATWRQRTSAAAKDCRTEQFLKPLKKAPWLFIDDIGNMQGNETAAEALNDLLEGRVHAGRLPILCTTQYDSEQLATRFPREETGLAICRRLRLLSNPIPF